MSDNKQDHEHDYTTQDLDEAVAILGIDRTLLDADDESKQTARKAVRGAFRHFAQYHPDHNPGDDGAEEKFKAANKAKEVCLYYLDDPDSFKSGGYGFGRERPRQPYSGVQNSSSSSAFDKYLGGSSGRNRDTRRGSGGGDFEQDLAALREARQKDTKTTSDFEDKLDQAVKADPLDEFRPKPRPGGKSRSHRPGGGYGF